MAVMSTTTSDYLSQSAGLPDHSTDWTVMAWCQNIGAPVVNLTDDKLIWAFFSSTLGDYTQPYLGFFVALVGGVQVVRLTGYDGSSTVSSDNAAVASQNWAPFAVTYNHTTHAVQAYVGQLVLSPSGTIIAFTALGAPLTLDFSSAPFLNLLALNGDSVALPGMAISQWRWWSQALTLPQFGPEAQSTQAVVTTNLQTDTPLLVSTDLADISGHSHDWTASGSLSTLWPGPFTASIAQLFACPNGGDVFATDVRAHVISQALFTISDISGVAAMRSGHVWACDNSGGSVSVLREIDPSDGSIVQSVTCAQLFGQDSGAHWLFEQPSGDLLAVESGTTGPLELISATTGAVVQTYALTGFSPRFDGAVNGDGTRLVYLDGQQYVRVWNLTTDSLAGTIYDYGSAGLWWPVWLSDGSILLSLGGYGANGNILRIGLDGTLLYTYTYDFSLLPSGAIGMAASLHENRLWVVGTSEVVTIALAPGGTLQTQFYPGSGL